MDFLGFEDEIEQDDDEESQPEDVETDLGEPPSDNADENVNGQINVEANGERRPAWSKEWQHFDHIVDADGQKFAKCKYCPR